MTSLKDLKNFFEDVKNRGLDVEMEESENGLKVTFYGVDYVEHRILPDDYTFEDYLVLNFGGSKRYWAAISGRGDIEVEVDSPSDGEAERKKIRIYPGVSIKSVSFDGNKYSVEFVEDEEE